MGIAFLQDIEVEEDNDMGEQDGREIDGMG